MRSPLSARCARSDFGFASGAGGCFGGADGVGMIAIIVSVSQVVYTGMRGIQKVTLPGARVIQLKEDDLQQMGVLKLAVPEYHLPKGLDLAAEPQPIEFQLINVTDAAKTP